MTERTVRQWDVWLRLPDGDSVLIGCVVARTAAMAKAELNRVLITFWSDKRGGVGMWIDDE